jgi:hypothetical protein
MSSKELTRVQCKRGMWVDHLLVSRKRTRGRHANETIVRFVESSAELNCIIAVRHGSQESESDSDVYKQHGS